MPPLKLLSHNVHLTEAQGGEEAFARMELMGIDLVRMDLRYRQMATAGGWQWNAGGDTRWATLLEPSLKWTREHGMRTLVNLIAYQVPGHAMAA